MLESTRRRGRGASLPSRAGAPAAVLAGGLLGASLRAAVGVLFPVPAGGFATPTLVVNVAGSFLLGIYLTRRERAVTRRWSLQFWAIGCLGSLTTFSAFSVEVVQLVAAEAVASALWYVVGSLAGGLAAALLGERLGRVGR